MLGFFVFGVLATVFVAELYVMFKKEEELEKKEEHYCNCEHCHCKENNKKEK